ncbi:hypothetical protein DRE_02228 [Drechslerella stenobrocha 248]|uniref:Thioredoxin-like fold domain-containing protein n=1 Tax=Drechslerella stenobrocha 248 TaxID=1043628 RepID=W7HYA2_9PEZI|nr:hypothetical protein DRE_02228 [Drechslerella stenobrocha 248]
MRASSQLCLLAAALFLRLPMASATTQLEARGLEAQAFHISSEGSVEGVSVEKNGMGGIEEVFRAAGKPPVPVEMFVMSKCPDARDCVAKLVLPVMARLYDTGKLALQPTFIGTPDDSNGGMACMHGPDECLGNIIELCAYKLYKSEPKRWLGFIYCMGNNYREIPKDEHVASCAREFGLNVELLGQCASSDEMDQGMEMLRTSARRAMQLRIKTSCTLTINGKTACVRDGGAWKGCSGSVDDIVEQIQKAYDSQ